MRNSIYLDHNATTPLLPAVADAMRECYAAPFLNPASQHVFGRRARQVLTDAVERIGELLGARTAGSRPDRVIVTSGGTEANNLAIFGLIGGRDAPAGHLLISAMEHPSVSRAAEYLVARGWSLDRIPLSSSGRVDVDEVESLLRPNTRLVSVMLASNETGVLQPVAELAEICQRHQVLLHTDAAQVVGKLPVDFAALGTIALTFASHKLHGPLGVGGLILRGGVPLATDLWGGSQQAGARPGTESVALVVGTQQALEAFHAEQDVRRDRLEGFRDRLETAIVNALPGVRILGCDAPRLPNTSNIAFAGLDRQALFMALDLAGVACATGSACASGSTEPSPTLVAMGCAKDIASSALRFSLGATTTVDDVEAAIPRIIDTAQGLYRRQGH